MIKTLQRRFALSKQGAVDLIKGCIACVAQDISFMLPVGLLYYFVIDTMNGKVSGSRIVFYVAGALVCLCLIFIATWFQYNATYLATYVESGVRRISLAEQLRKIPLSFFGKKDLADLTNSIMGDCATLEAGIFPLCTRFGRFPYLNNFDWDLSFCLRLAHGSCGGLGFADCICDYILFRPHTGIFQPKIRRGECRT